MITTNHNSPNGAPYLRHAREREHRPHDGWTVTVKIAIPKPRHWLVCSTGWIVMLLVYLASTLWIGGFHKDWYLSNNSSSWNTFLPGPVTTFLPIRAVHDTDAYEGLLGEPNTNDLDPLVPSAATTSNWLQVVPSSDRASAPIVLSESKEEIEASGLTLPGSNPTNVQGDHPAHNTIPDEHLKHEQNARFHPKWTEFDEQEASPNGTTLTSESRATEPGQPTTTVMDSEAPEGNSVNTTLITAAPAPDRAPLSNYQSSGGARNESFGLSDHEGPAATYILDRKVEGEDPEATKTQSAEYSTVEAPVDISEIPIEDVNVESKDEGTPWSRASVQSKEFHNSPVDESSLQARRHEFATEVEADAPAQELVPTTTVTNSSESDASNSQNSNSAPPTSPTSAWNPFPAELLATESKVESEPESQRNIPPTASAFWNSEVEPVIRATNIKGRKAVESFRNQLDCFSESGKWVYDPTPRRLPWNYVGEHYLSKCDGYHWGVWGDEADIIAKDGVGDWSVREELKWIWKTNETCPLGQVDRNEFCWRLGPKRNIMVVGDSLNHGLSWSIMNHLITNGTGYQAFPNYDRISDGVYEMCGDIFGEGNGLKISFVRNDRLSLTSDAVYEYHTNFHEYPWLDLVQKYGVKTLILNRGAHYENDTAYEKALREAFTAVRDRYPNVQVIYRNTPPGHANCTNMTTVPPLTERQQFGWDGIKWPDIHSWGSFTGQNILARKIVDEFGYIYMDVDTMLALRADGHPDERDCLHYCLPGPFDVAVQLLYNVLPFL